MADEQEKQYIKNLKHNAFMGTIAVCVVYGIIAFLLILYVNLTEQGKGLYNELRPFALTFIFGTLFIIIVTTLLVLNWEPEQAKKATLNDVLNNQFSCPDYYKLTETETEEKNNLLKYTSNISKDTWLDPNSKIDFNNYAITNNDLIKTKCVHDDKVYSDIISDTGKYTYFPQTVDSADEDPAAIRLTDLTTSGNLKSNKDRNDIKALAAFTGMYGGYGKTYSSSCGSSDSFNYQNPYCISDEATTHQTGKTDIYDCKKVYPEYLAQLDAEEYIRNNEDGPKNLHRCEWSKKCGIPWSSAGCG